MSNRRRASLFETQKEKVDTTKKPNSHPWILQLFEKYDVNGDGSISHKEFKQLCFDMGYHLTDEELLLDMALLDTNGDGGIEFKEFSQWWKSDHRFKQLQLSPEELETLHKIAKDFQRYDKDKSGRIDVKEFKLLYNDLVKNNVTTKSLFDTLAELDLNKDGHVTFNEYVHWSLKEKQKLQNPPSKGQSLQAL
ncbi:hypothetical protein BC833DRAFT_571538 [Globomyces pollinis-pini]|nr:hypothetical protein BC833DRAFT_571538 [Globomyces pollinis-pini]